MGDDASHGERLSSNLLWLPSVCEVLSLHWLCWCPKWSPASKKKDRKRMFYDEKCESLPLSKVFGSSIFTLDSNVVHLDRGTASRQGLRRVSTLAVAGAYLAFSSLFHSLASLLDHFRYWATCALRWPTAFEFYLWPCRGLSTRHPAVPSDRWQCRQRSSDGRPVTSHNRGEVHLITQESNQQYFLYNISFKKPHGFFQKDGKAIHSMKNAFIGLFLF